MTEKRDSLMIDTLFICNVETTLSIFISSLKPGS